MQASIHDFLRRISQTTRMTKAIAAMTIRTYGKTKQTIRSPQSISNSLNTLIPQPVASLPALPAPRIALKVKYRLKNEADRLDIICTPTNNKPPFIIPQKRTNFNRFLKKRTKKNKTPNKHSTSTQKVLPKNRPIPHSSYRLPLYRLPYINARFSRDNNQFCYFEKAVDFLCV